MFIFFLFSLLFLNSMYASSVDCEEYLPKKEHALSKSISDIGIGNVKKESFTNETTKKQMIVYWYDEVPSSIELNEIMSIAQNNIEAVKRKNYILLLKKDFEANHLKNIFKTIFDDLEENKNSKETNILLLRMYESIFYTTASENALL